MADAQSIIHALRPHLDAPPSRAELALLLSEMSLAHPGALAQALEGVSDDPRKWARVLVEAWAAWNCWSSLEEEVDALLNLFPPAIILGAAAWLRHRGVRQNVPLPGGDPVRKDAGTVLIEGGLARAIADPARIPTGPIREQLHQLGASPAGECAVLRCRLAALLLGAALADAGAVPPGPAEGMRFVEQFAVGAERFRMRFVAAGTYTVGSKSGPDSINDETPRHWVQFNRAFAVGELAVTQGLFAAVMGVNPARFCDGPEASRHPVERVSWNDAVEFCNRLSERCGLAPAYRIAGASVTCDFAAPGFRLPTEHEWETAARARTDARFSGGDVADAVGWFSDNSGGRTHPVGQKSPNRWGLCDLSGNVWEWCWDWYDPSAYTSRTVTQPAGPRSGSGRVLRGGAWYLPAASLRVANRYSSAPASRLHFIGFRLTRTLPDG